MGCHGGLGILGKSEEHWSVQLFCCSSDGSVVLCQGQASSVAHRSSPLPQQCPAYQVRPCLIKTRIIFFLSGEWRESPILTIPTHFSRFAQSQGLQITGFSNFGPASYVELNSPVAKGAVPLFEEERLLEIATRHHKKVAQVILRWLIQNNVAVIPKSSDPTRIAENANIFDFQLSPEDMETINGMNIPLRLNDPAGYANIPIYA